MKALESPRTGKIGTKVAYPSRYGQCYRALVIPRDPQTPAQLEARMNFGAASRGWIVNLTDTQREHWITAALNAPSQPWLGEYGHLSGQQFWMKINNTLRAIGQTPVNEPPAPVAFAPSPVGQFTITNDDEDGIRLLLNVGTVTEDIMVYGQAPCSRGRSKVRRVCYLGLLPSAVDGQCDITALYTARFGTPAPGMKVFLVTCQQKNGWKGKDQVTSATVPSRSAPAVASGILPDIEPGILPGGQDPGDGGVNSGGKMPPSTAGKMPAATAQAQSEPVSPSPIHVYNGCTPDAQRMQPLARRGHPGSTPWAPVVHSLRVALGRLLAIPSLRMR